MANAPAPPPHVPRYVPARTNEGWPIAGLVLLLVALCIVTTTIIHKRTYKHPTDPTYHIRGNPATEGTAH
ncbi:MAG TPA: hypothetical protein VJ867_10400 [Gemmatimonadaceae bacterium]|nr:hypothetical protein [Gemmatimonadaceae bacterium]